MCLCKNCVNTFVPSGTRKEIQDKNAQKTLHCNLQKFEEFELMNKLVTC